MTISGKNLIAGEWSGDLTAGFSATDAIRNQAMKEVFAQASKIEISHAIERADQAFVSYSQLPATARASFLRTIGEQIIAIGDELIDMACAETGLPALRIQSERGRTVAQLGLFANLLEQGEYQGVIDVADMNRQPVAKPDTRLGYLPLGVVAVFGASNFPLAFSTAGGDTASALAAGCPVIMKAHDAHPGTSELVAQAISRAITLCGIDAGVFSLIQGKNYQITSQIIMDPLVKAVGFTGSQRVGMILQQQIHQREEPIPFYGELGSVNPQFILQDKMANDGRILAQELVASLIMGQGQFCTSPGIWAYITHESCSTFELSASEAIQATTAGVMLTPEIANSYKQAVATWQNIDGVELLAKGQADKTHFCQAALFATDLATFKANKSLQIEVFGACALMLRLKDQQEMMELISLLKGNLTASIHATDNDSEQSHAISMALAHKVGRLIYNQMPTGVEVCASMNHGGPFPASTDLRTTSVGSEAIKRFQRPICYQNMPKELLPAQLQ
ncbi:aldehyde dehydrogenase (NADP(+)) [Thalassotalea sp. G2M2-11]|uniref:aldehyde dehydrogenase (NADP(+)) n=1 Tax=Thalassotalea sp. G2M2-11 TaxID=2787627 RepID=UPI0019D04DEB|nr:aldehyde dehydrogenase (NADP(+)) [Thalassotalea sp. G2M2-11]